MKRNFSRHFRVTASALMSAALLSGAAPAFSCAELPALSDIEALPHVEDAELLAGVSAVYSAEDDSLIIQTSARGCESDVVLMVGVDSEGKVNGIQVVSHGETPGVGGKALEEEYLSGYIGLDDFSEIDAFAGATFTSDAIRADCQAAVNQFRSINGLAFEAASSDEETAYALAQEFLGDDMETVEIESPVKNVESVFRSDAGFVVCVSGKGYYEDQPIILDVCLTPEGKVSCIKVVSQHETPDNGDQVFREGYLSLYNGGKKFAMFDMGDGSTIINSFSGASISSFSLCNLVNAATMQVAALK